MILKSIRIINFTSSNISINFFLQVYNLKLLKKQLYILFNEMNILLAIILTKKNIKLYIFEFKGKIIMKIIKANIKFNNKL